MSARIAVASLALLGGLLLTATALAQGVVVVQEAPASTYAPPAYAPPAYAPPPPYAYPPPPERVPPVEDETKARGFSMKLSAGPAYQRIFDSGIAGADFGLFLGGVRGTSGWYGGMEVLVGRMDHGLFTYAVRPGATWEARLGRVHLGLGLNFLVIGVQRATTGEYMQSGGGGASAFATVDLVRGEEHALFLGAKMRAEIVGGSDAGGSTPILWGPSAALGWRLF